MTYVVLVWVSPYEETEVRCFSALAKALDSAADAQEVTEQSGGNVRVWAWSGERQYDINCQGWLQAKAGRHMFAAQWLKEKSLNGYNVKRRRRNYVR